MSNFSLIKSYPDNVDYLGLSPNSAFWYTQGFNRIVRGNEVFVSNGGSIMYSSDNGISYNTVILFNQIDGGERAKMYEIDGDIFLAIDINNVQWYYFGGNQLLPFFASVEQAGFVHKFVKQDSTNLFMLIAPKVIQNIVRFAQHSWNQNVGIVTYHDAIITTGNENGDMGGIANISGIIHFTVIDGSDTKIYKWDGVSTVLLHTKVNVKIIEIYEFNSNVYYYDTVAEQVGTIDLNSGVLSAVSVVTHPNIYDAYMRQYNNQLHLFLTDKYSSASLSKVYEFDGVSTFTEVLTLDESIGYVDETPSSLYFGSGKKNNTPPSFNNPQPPSNFYGIACSLVYDGYLVTPETNLNGNDGTITHQVSGEVGVLEFRLLDAFEVEVATWQANPLFENLAPATYYLEAKDDNCTIRKIGLVGVLTYQSNPVEQQASRTRYTINTSNFTRFYQLFGMTLDDFQNLNGQLPPPIDQEISLVDANVRVTNEGFTRVTSDGGRRVISGNI